MSNLNQNEEEVLGKAIDIELIKRLLGYAKKYWKTFIIALLLMLGSIVADLSSPYLVKIAIDKYINAVPNPMVIQTEAALQAFRLDNINAVKQLGLIYIGIILAGFILNISQIYILSNMGQSIIFSLRQQVFDHLQKMSLSFFDKNPVGRLVTRVTNDIETLNETYSNVFVNLVKDILILLGIVILLIKLNIKLAIVTLAILPFVILVTAIFRIKAREIYRKVRVNLAKINTVLSENLNGMKIIQIFSKDKEKFKEFKEVNTQYYKTGMSEIVVFGIFKPFIELFSTLSIASLIWFGGVDVIKGTIEFGVLYAFINYVGIFFRPINDFSEKYNILQSAMASSERIFLILDSETEKDIGSINIDNKDIKGDIEFKNVWFSYKENEWILKDVSFKVPAGETLAIVGATGAGKTTIINLVNRFYEIQKGEILLDGINIKDIQKASLRRKIGVVLQDPFIFSSTVKDNIVLNNKNFSSDKIQEISEYVNAHSFINDLQNKYDFAINERGTVFSTGQRQLLAFARTLITNPSILILDEATSNIDTQTELLIQDALRKITKNQTTIIIAHRLSTIQHADNIVVLHKGVIREMGSHFKLLEKKGLYFKLYNLQYIK